ncbi:helix-turn-helix domain-containing protein [Paenibacillus cremeus]|uniref:Helix-turn-helix transcriptional regulator n=1 Tax=Paenibacillus cremeus TaxID=2163881 RepID=A0A559KFB1_9BACL|nr:AraC family transcriptional regulator [Paenibacillus cremeus]TVY10822.1 helix-turn-helix transcriptional regulator [Paenibacillus cremeus]
MKSIERGTDKGILHAKAGKQKFSLHKYEPAAELAPLIEHYWVVQWDLKGQAPYRQTILSYPNVNMAFEKDYNGCFAGIYGVPKTTYTRHLQDDGMALGIKFRPGGFYPFWRQPVSLLTGRTIPVSDVFGMSSKPVEERILTQSDGESMVQLAEHFLLQQLPEPDEQVALIGGMMHEAAQNRDILQVEDMVHLFGISKRTLQRLFSRYVGVSPKWVIQRYRLQEAAELIERSDNVDWTVLSQELGYYDQAHFIKDFKAVIGRSPEAYARGLGG